MATFRLRGTRYWIDYYQDGKRVCRPLKTAQGRPVKDRKLAKSLTQDIEDQLNKGETPFISIYVDPFKALEAYKEYCRTLKTPHAIATSHSNILKYLAASDIRNLSKINDETLKDYLDRRLLANEIGNITANNIIKCVKAFLNYCKNKKHIPETTPTIKLRYKEETKLPKFLTKEELDKFIQLPEQDQLYPPIVTAIYTGMRLGELMRAQPADIDFIHQTITIPKSKSGHFRVIGLHPVLAKTLQKYPPPFNFSNEQKRFNILRGSIGLKWVGWHHFRHSFASWLLMSGVGIETVSYLLGHGDLETTMIYVHLTKQHVYKAIERFDIVPNKIVTTNVTPIVTKNSTLYSAILG